MPGRAIITKSVPVFMFFAWNFIISDNLRLTLFLAVAFLETFKLTTNPNLFSPKSFSATLKIKRLFLKLFDFLKIVSKSFFFFILIEHLTKEQITEFGSLTFLAEIIKNVLFAIALFIYARNPYEKQKKGSNDVPYLDMV